MEEKSKKDGKKDPKVVLFGNEVDDGESREERRFRFHHHHHGSLTWGLVIIVLGIMFLLSNFGALPPVVWLQVLRLWPVLIILIGVETLLGHSEVSEIISSLFALMIFVIILGVVFINSAPQLLTGLPQPMLNFLQTINGYIITAR